MEISGSSIRHRTGVPKQTNSLEISSTNSAKTVQQTQSDADNAPARQSEVLYERSKSNERKKDRSFETLSDQIGQQTEDSEESGVINSSHHTYTATTQQTNGVEFLKFVKWFHGFLPGVSTPDRKIELGEKRLWTIIVLFIFMICCQIPLYGIKSTKSVDHFFHMRVIRASHRGTLMEFGIMFIAESQFILLILNWFKVISVHDTQYNHGLLNRTQRVLALLLTVVHSVLFITSGMYGEPKRIGVALSLLISMQLLIGGLITLLLNDIVKNGYCLGTEISLFMVANICGTIMWKAFSPLPVYTDQGAEYEGAIVFLLQLLSTERDKMFVLRRAFFRENLPNLMNFLATIFVFVTVIYLKGFLVQLPLKSTMRRGLQTFYPIKLLYTSVAPAHLQSTFVPTFNLFSQVLSANFHENFFVDLLGVWADVTDDGLPRSYPIGGLCYYLSPPRNPLQVIQDPVYAAVYTVFMIGSCALYSRILINFIHISAVDVAKELRDKNMVMLRHGEQTMLIELDRYVSTAAVLGGLCIGALSVLADFLGVFGSGTGVILAAFILYEYAELDCKLQNVQNQQITLLF